MGVMVTALTDARPVTELLCARIVSSGNSCEFLLADVYLLRRQRHSAERHETQEQLCDQHRGHVETVSMPKRDGNTTDMTKIIMRVLS
jgi:hypothetical protein